MLNRRTFLGVISTLAVPGWFSSSIVLDSASSRENLAQYNANKKLKALVYIPGYLRFGVFAQLTEDFLQKLNKDFENIHFISSDTSATAQIILSSPSLDYQSKKMILICRSPGGLNRPDFNKWLKSKTAKKIYQEAYHKKGFQPFILSLGPSKNYQPVNISKNYRSDKILFGSSIANSFRSAIKEIEVQNLSSLLVARRKIESAELLSMEALQPKVAATFKSPGIILLEDGLAAQPQIYQALVKNELWDSITLEQRNEIVEKLAHFGQKLDNEIVQNDLAFESNLASTSELEKLPHLVAEMRQLEYIFAKNFIEHQAVRSNIIPLYEEFQSYRSSPSLKLV